MIKIKQGIDLVGLIAREKLQQAAQQHTLRLHIATEVLLRICQREAGDSHTADHLANVAVARADALIARLAMQEPAAPNATTAADPAVKKYVCDVCGLTRLDSFETHAAKGRLCNGVVRQVPLSTPTIWRNWWQGSSAPMPSPKWICDQCGKLFADGLPGDICGACTTGDVAMGHLIPFLQ